LPDGNPGGEKMRSTVVIALASVAVGLAVSLAPVRVAATHSMCNRIDGWGQTFMDEHPDYTVVVVGVSTNKAVERLLDGTVDLCLIDTPISEETKRGLLVKGMRLEQRLLMHDGIAVITHPRLTLTDISLEQLAKIHGGEYLNWSQVGGPNMPITAWGEGPDVSTTAAIFPERSFDPAHLARTIKLARNPKTLIEIISQNEGAIGCLSYMYLIEDRGTDPRAVKLLRIKKDRDLEGVAPTAQTIKSGAYPLVRPLYLYWNQNPSRDWLKRFVDFLNPSLM